MAEPVTAEAMRAMRATALSMMMTIAILGELVRSERRADNGFERTSRVLFMPRRITRIRSYRNGNNEDRQFIKFPLTD